jgi:hypothetical protein
VLRGRTLTFPASVHGIKLLKDIVRISGSGPLSIVVREILKITRPDVE